MSENPEFITDKSKPTYRPLDQLPPEITYDLILSCLSLPSLICFSRTSKNYRHAVYSHPFLWRDLLFTSIRRRYRINDAVITSLLGSLDATTRAGVRNVDLDGTLVTYRGLRAVLRDCPGVQRLSIERCRGITSDSVAEELRVLPVEAVEVRQALATALIKFVVFKYWCVTTCGTNVSLVMALRELGGRYKGLLREAYVCELCGVGMSCEAEGRGAGYGGAEDHVCAPEVLESWRVG
ncbi:hypothetical protein BC936DRAFT_143852 [Jimgerdemannia flammicorona]|uniref:F-box domain-containing protein n=1 Tax=Jimgerdemannia flammicorona TaxID=994334 RepID=A0A433DDE3_9FUNG|nr:hypothetical protein BC936DRAFT_143852 [Jimgerdemannia flammicorona]